MPVLGANYPFIASDASLIGMYDDLILNVPPTAPVGDLMKLGDTSDRQKVRLSVFPLVTPAKTGYGAWIKRKGIPAQPLTLAVGLAATALDSPTTWTTSAVSVDASMLSEQCYTFVYFSDVVIPTTGGSFAWVVAQTSQTPDPNNHYVIASTYIQPEDGEPDGGFYQWNGTSWATSGTNYFPSGVGSHLLTATRNLGQTFYVDRNLRLDSLQVALASVGSLTGKLKCVVYEARQVPSIVNFWTPSFALQQYDPISGQIRQVTNTEILATSRELDASTIPGSPTTFEFMFDLSPVFEFGKHYAFVFVYDNPSELDATHNILFAADMVESTYSDGTAISSPATANPHDYSMIFGDLMFQLYYSEATVLAEQLSTLGNPPADCGAMQSWLKGLVNLLSNYFPNVIPEVYGGTGESTFNKGDMLYAIEDDNLARLPMSVTAGRILTAGENGLPQWGRGGGVVLQELWNLTGGQLDPGDVVVFKNDLPTPPGSVGTVNAFGFDRDFAGVVQDIIPNNGRGMVATHGVVRVRLSGSCTVGDGLNLSNVPRRVHSVFSGHAPMRALQNGTDGQLIYAFINGNTSDVPTGAMIMWGTESPPAGWLLCDGSTHSRTTFAKLFSVIGTRFGAGDGSTTFAVPDFRGRNPMGLDNMQTTTGSANRVTNVNADVMGGSGGAETHTLSLTEMPQHRHFLGNAADNGTGNFGPNSPSNAFLDNTAGRNTDPQYTDWTGSTQPHNNMQPWLAVNMIIKYA